MLAYDPLLRISAADVILDSYFNDLIVIEAHPFDINYFCVCLILDS